MDEGKKYIIKKEIYRKMGFGTPNTSESDLEFHPVCKIVYKKWEEFNKKKNTAWQVTTNIQKDIGRSR